MRSIWTKPALLAGLFMFASLGFAEEKGVRRLESVNWDPVKKELTWVVSNGSQPTKGKYQPNDKVTYHIDMDNATMSFNGEVRKFSRQEAMSVSNLMTLIATYAVESTIWWEKGYGDKVSGGEKVGWEQPEDAPKCEQPRFALISMPTRGF